MIDQYPDASVGKIGFAIFTGSEFASWDYTINSAQCAGLVTSVTQTDAPLGHSSSTSDFTTVCMSDKTALVDLIDSMCSEGFSAIAIATRPVDCSGIDFQRMAEMLSSNANVGAIVPLTNGPHKQDLPANSPIAYQLGQNTQTDINALLKESLGNEPWAPVSVVSGILVVISTANWSLIRELVKGSRIQPDHLVAQMTSFYAERGVLNLISLQDFATWRSDMDCRLGLSDFDYTRGFLNPTVDIEQSQLVGLDVGTPAYEFKSSIASSISGMKILVDASCLGPMEMGTQVALTSLVRELAKHPKISYLGLAVPGRLPIYARDLMLLNSLDILVAPPENFRSFPYVDIIHRPLQPDGSTNPRHYTNHARRVSVTVHDLIAYRTPSYHPGSQEWRSYRDGLRRFLYHSDLIHAISNDVLDAIRLEMVCPDMSRVMVVPNGVDHLSRSSEMTMPKALEACIPNIGQYFLVIGTNYGHKNLDFAASVVDSYNRRHNQQFDLVIGGAQVPLGSTSRVQVLTERNLDNLRVIRFGELTSSERNWLYKHATVVLYPTSAEGFGLIPEEAARFETPTIFTRFGPLKERYQTANMLPDDWNLESWVNKLETIVEDQETRTELLELILASTKTHTWSTTSYSLVRAFEQTLYRAPITLQSTT